MDENDLESMSVKLTVDIVAVGESEMNSHTPSERSVTRSLISMPRTLSLLLSLRKS